MSTCERCGATFHCAMRDGPDDGSDNCACWCTHLPPVVPVPRQEERETVGCWCPKCLREHIAAQS